MNLKVKELVLAAMFASLVAVGAFIKIPFLIVPITLQTLFVVLLALVLRKEMALLSVCLYISIGLIGFPVFANGGGIMYVLSPTFGYLMGFVAGAYFIASRKNSMNIYVVTIIGLLIIYLLGVSYFILIQYIMLGKLYTLNYLFVKLFLIFLPGDILSILLAIVVYKKCIKFL